MGKELVDRRKAWVMKLRIGKPVSKYMKVCSLHFNGEDYFRKGDNSKGGRILKKIAVPSKKLPSSSVRCSSASRRTSSTRMSRLRSRRLIVNSNVNVEVTGACEPKHTDDDMAAADALLELLSSQPDLDEEKLNEIVNIEGQQNIHVRDAGIQVDTPKVSTLSELLLNDNALRCFTGISTFRILDCIVDLVLKVFQDQRSHRLNVRDRIILTMIKIKLDLSYVTLAILFNISGQLCKQYFFEMLSILSSVLKPCIYFPSSDEISLNMPECFNGFENTRVVLDCTEIFIQRPTCLCCRIRFYSHYKSNSTVKFMTGVSPAGNITFISKGYGGRASDKVIFEESGLIEKLDPNKDSIMVDKGFMIDDLCATHRIQIIRPPFLRKKKQLSAEEAFLNKKIAAARVHIERSNQRLKIFKMLSGKLQWSLVPKIEEIFTIVCAITNLSAPILSDQRF